MRVEATVTSADRQPKRIAEQAARVDRALTDFTPALCQIDNAITGTSNGITKTHERVSRLIDTSETIVQSTAHSNKNSVDARLVTAAQKTAGEISGSMEAAVASGRNSFSGVFDRTYYPIPGTNPPQVPPEATKLPDDILPRWQEPALELDPKVVFCAAVDVNGYLPTHNRKFSKPPTDDPVRIAANCRNRRIFDDRVWLKAGKNTEPFLLKVYGRDIGGGTFKMMKDLSSPITVQGKHWSGLRLAYSFE